MGSSAYPMPVVLVSGVLALRSLPHSSLPPLLPLATEALLYTLLAEIFEY